ncbi:hypothetical protein [Hydrogenophaga sp.]|uniref:hypothetical protein n=1 Tax=Hydrogenophaga sp. TaxID=1904254 RepID=UPI0027214567|nr:hypothetical protein [Hydrogenophaga sp.]MDO9436879.1 hypothetical protein [Hydrogenophaga sp.]
MKFTMSRVNGPPVQPRPVERAPIVEGDHIHPDEALTRAAAEGNYNDYVTVIDVDARIDDSESLVSSNTSADVSEDTSAQASAIESPAGEAPQDGKRDVKFASNAVVVLLRDEALQTETLKPVEFERSHTTAQWKKESKVRQKSLTLLSSPSGTNSKKLVDSPVGREAIGAELKRRQETAKANRSLNVTELQLDEEAKKRFPPLKQPTAEEIQAKKEARSVEKAAENAAKEQKRIDKAERIQKRADRAAQRLAEKEAKEQRRAEIAAQRAANGLKTTPNPPAAANDADEIIELVAAVPVRVRALSQAPSTRIEAMQRRMDNCMGDHRPGARACQMLMGVSATLSASAGLALSAFTPRPYGWVVQGGAFPLLLLGVALIGHTTKRD